MNTKIIVSAAAAFGRRAGSACGQSSTVSGAAGGAVTGAIVGTAIDPPPQKVVTYVEEQPMPSRETVVQDRIVVGRPLPETVVVTPVPDNPTYAYAYVNHERVIVQPKTRKVVKILE